MAAADTPQQQHQHQHQRLAKKSRPASKTEITASKRAKASPTSPASWTAKPVPTLVTVFCFWRAFLLSIALLATCLGPAYDTSASLLLGPTQTRPTVHRSPHNIAVATAGSGAPGVVSAAALSHIRCRALGSHLVSRLTSWDAIYFLQVTRRGYLYEQEWAFGPGLPAVVSLCQRGLKFVGVTTRLSESLLAICVSHLSHLLSALVLHRLCLLLLCSHNSKQGRDVEGDATQKDMAFVAAVLHILSPAGLFLSAPYAESTFALLSFAGYLVFAAAGLKDIAGRPSLSGDVLRVVAGVIFGLSVTFRTNGLLNGLLFAYDTVVGLNQWVRRPGSWPVFRHLVCASLGGLAVAAGSIVPQFVAYRRFCSEPSGVPGEDLRPWCNRLPPSIYAFVQAHYWNVGLFKYWTLSNIPLFLLAAPMLSVLLLSSWDIWQGSIGSLLPPKMSAAKGRAGKARLGPRFVSTVYCMAAVQALLAAMALISYHVQIITRLSSAYPVWYLWLANSLSGGSRHRLAMGIVVFMVMYASIQGMLFASFLPPA